MADLILITSLLLVTTVTVDAMVNPSPHFGNVSLTQYFNEGDDARILCPSFLGDPARSPIWFHDLNIVNTRPNSRYVLHEDELDQSLEILSIEISDSGVYHCTLLLDVNPGSIFKEIIVNVYPSSPMVPSIDKSIPIRTFWYLDDLELTCNVVSRDQPVTYEWSIKGVLQADTSPTLHRENNTYESGEYRCAARNAHGVDVFSINVMVNAPPLPVQLNLDHVVVQQGHTATLRNTVPNTPVMLSQLDFEWSKQVNGEEGTIPILSEPRITRSFQGWLTIRDTQVSDTGIYVVNVTNEFGASLQSVLLLITPSPCDIGDVRLVGGNDSYEGRVEVCLDDAWRSVCDSSWTTTTTEVACRQAGFSFITGAMIVRNHTFGVERNESVVLSNENCDGSEVRLSDCTEYESGANRTQCAHGGDVGIQCPSNVCVTGNIRLVGGTVRSEGRVEVCDATQTWHPVCFNSFSKWDQVNAGVACRQAGFSNEGAKPLELPGSLSDQSLPKVVFCRGAEESLFDCDDLSVLLLDGRFSDTKCSIAGVRCLVRHSNPHLQTIIIGTVASTVVLVLLCVLAIYPARFLRTRLLNRRRDHQGPLYEAVDEIMAPPLPPIRAHHVRTVRNISYDSTSHLAHTSELNDPNSTSDHYYSSPHISISTSASDLYAMESEDQSNPPDCDDGLELTEQTIQDHPDELEVDRSQLLQTTETRHYRADTDETQSMRLIGKNPLAEECKHELTAVIEDGDDDIVLQSKSSHDHCDQSQQVCGYETIGGYERAPPIDIDVVNHLTQCLPSQVVQPEHCYCSDDNGIAGSNSNPIGSQHSDDELTKGVSQEQDSKDYNQIQGYELIGGYEAIGGYERAPPIDIEHLSQCLPVSVLHNKHCDNFEVADDIDNDGVDNTVTSSQVQDSNEYDQVQGYELIGGYEAIGGYERAPPIDIDHLSQFTSHQIPSDPRREHCFNCSDDNNLIERHNPNIIENDQQSCEDQDYDRIQSYELVPQLQHSDITNVHVKFSKHSQNGLYTSTL